ncbi:2416_t:CDS:2 [Cetraspora pellucida]|uniref:2416_t:CDS:1 n=1 Tax=Cetraspora pellucida TaxID=1433469 RepID=A0A9N9FQV3_9GLOM|nr:2416_t:CDS:2 [Cetraspora pellucida]
MFERETAARTALMLTNAFIGESQINVKPAGAPSSDECLDDGEGYDGQEGKPKLMIFAEILAAGYQLSETILNKGAKFDAKYGFSAFVKQYWSFVQAYCLAFDDKYKVYDTVTAKAHEIDTKYSVQEKVHQVQDKALGSSTGKLVVDLYANATKQVGDIHCLAKRIANERKSAHADNTIEAH